jgi:hypothetical protein
MRRVVATCVLVGCSAGSPPTPAPPSRTAVTPAAPAAPNPAPESAPAASVPGAKRVVLPNGLVHVVLVGFDTAPALDLDAARAAARRDAVTERYRTTYLDTGHEKWFFHAFDDRELVFVVARWEPRSPSGGRYIATQRLRVARSTASVRTLGLEETIREYEVGTGGLRAGMNPDEVRAVKGPPLGENQLGPFGAFDWVYDDLCVRFLEGRVSDVRTRDRCRTR